MNYEDVQKSVNKIFSEVMDVDIDKLSPEMTADDVPAWDSVSHVRLVMTVESSVGVTFSNDDIGSFEKLGDIADTAYAMISTR